MNLQAQLDAFKTQFQSGQPPFDGVPKEVHAIMQRGTDALIAKGAANAARHVGELAPSFDLADASGARVRLTDLLAEGPVVLSFYRGVWCPYCNIELKSLEAARSEIEALGARIVTITPTSAANSRKAMNDNHLGFPVLTDVGNAVAEAYGLRFRLSDELIALYSQLGANLPAFNGDDSWTLPMPGRFLIDTKGVIQYASVNPDYTKRPDPSELLPALRRLKAGAESVATA